MRFLDKLLLSRDPVEDEEAATKRYVDANAGGSVGDAEFTKVERRVDMNILHQTWTPVPWDAEVEDTNGWWLSSNPTRIVAGTAGLYLVMATCTFPFNSNGTRALRLNRNSEVASLASPFAAAADDQHGRNQLTGIIRCAAGDVLVVEVRQDSGGQRTFGQGGQSALPIPYFAVSRMK